jgi:hypothetical protein
MYLVHTRGPASIDTVLLDIVDPVDSGIPENVKKSLFISWEWFWIENLNADF